PHRGLVAGLGPGVQQRQPPGPQLGELVGALVEHVAGHRVAADPPQAREAPRRGVEQRPPVVHRHAERVAIGHEQLLDPRPEAARREVEVLEQLRQRPQREDGLVAVHRAVGAVVPRAADRGLQDEGVGFG
ncbi:MAG: hypothetical protein ACK56I_13510, partial [bacterium]